MKFVEIRDLELINQSLHFDTPDCRVIGSCDLYTTKAAGIDKKLYKTIDQHLDSIQHDNLLLSSSLSPPSVPIFKNSSSLGSSNSSFSRSLDDFSKSNELPSSVGFSPFGPLDQVSSRRTFAYLITVLNASHPDHDFSSLRPIDFKRERSYNQVINNFNNSLFGVGMPVPPRLWEIVDDHIALKDSIIYSYQPADSFLADEPGTLWSMMWFFFNKRRKRVAYIYLKATRLQSPVVYPKSVEDDASDDGTYELNTQYSDDEVVGDLELE